MLMCFVLPALFSSADPVQQCAQWVLSYTKNLLKKLRSFF